MKNSDIRPLFITRITLRIALVIICFALLLQCKVKKQVSELKTTSTVEKYNAPDHFSDLYAAAEMKYGFKGSSLSDFEKWQKEFRPELKKLLGLHILVSVP